MNIGGEVALARQCIKSVLSGKFYSLLEKGTQVENKGNQQDATDKSQHGKPTKLSEAYITGKSSSQVSFFLGDLSQFFFLSCEKVFANLRL